jgi:uncharacterized membrane protein
MEQKQVSDLAMASMILGILSFMFFGPFAAIPAIICGHISISRIRQEPDRLTGRDMAVAGLIMGYIQLLISALIIAFIVFFFVMLMAGGG